MNMQELTVILIVSVAALYLGAKYLPVALRARLVLHLTKDGRQSALARWLDTSAGGACGGGSCNSCGPKTAAPAPGKHRVIKLHQR
jgi:hypothetical protein